MMFRKETEFQKTEIGEFPKDWEIKKLREIAKIETGKREKGGGKEAGEVISLGGENISLDGKLILNPSKYISKEFYNSLKSGKVKEKDILLVKDGATTGKAAFVEKLPAKEVAVNEHLFIIRGYNVDQKFLYYIIISNIFQNQIKSLFHGIIGGITKAEIEEVYIPLPPLEEQKRIADILSIIDSGIETVDRAVAKLEGMKRALLNELLTGRIRVREENGRLTFYKEKEFKDTEIGKIPKDWKLVKLSNIAEDIYYGITAKAVEHKTGLKMLRTTDIKDYNVDWDSLPFCEITEKRGNIQRFLLKKGDIIIARAGTTGVCVLVEKDLGDVIFGSYLIKVRLNKDVYPRFIYYFCQSRFYWNQITSGQAGSTIKNINLPLLKSLNIPLPSSVKEQTAITEILSTVDKAIELYRKEKERLSRLRRGLMSVLLTGRVRVIGDVRMWG